MHGWMDGKKSACIAVCLVSSLFGWVIMSIARIFVVLWLIDGRRGDDGGDDRRCGVDKVVEESRS